MQKKISQAITQSFLNNFDQVCIQQRETQFLYHNIWEKIQQYKLFLVETSVSSGNVVAVHCDKNVDQICWVLALVLLGATFVPLRQFQSTAALDQFCSEQSFDFCINENSVTHSESRAYPCFYHKNFELIQYSEIPAHSKSPLLYICYTSGTTGAPKGVAVRESAVLNTFFGMARLHSLTQSDAIFSVSRPSFDLYIYDVFASILAGAKIVLPVELELNSPNKWLSLCNSHHVTVWNSAPALLQLAIESNQQVIQSLKAIFLSGDWVSLSLSTKAREIAPNATIYSLGGATEAGIWSVYHKVSSDDVEFIPYGKALTGQSLYLINDESEIVPLQVDAEGELCIGGQSLADGYWQRPKITAQRFLDHKTLGKLYKTGDRVRCLQDGETKILGRVDALVKISGLWCDIDEIKNVLDKHDAVQSAHVIFDHEKATVFAGVILRKQCIESELIEHLSKSLTSKMPAIKIHFLPTLPLTEHGKLDHAYIKKLIENQACQQNQLQNTAPLDLSTEEVILSQFWQQAFGSQPQKKEEDFIENGATSFQLFKFIGIVNQAFGINITIQMLLENSTFGKLSLLVESEKTQCHIVGHESPFQGETLLTTSDQIRLFYLAQQCMPGTYHLPVMMEVQGNLDYERLDQALNTLVMSQPALRMAFADYSGETLELSKDLAISINKSIDNIAELILTPIDCFKAPLWHVSVDESEAGWRLLFVVHHALLDGLSAYQFIYELLDHYENNRADVAAHNTYAICDAKSEFNQSERVAFWQSRLKQPPIIELPTCYPRAESQSYEGDSFIYQFEPAFIENIKSAAKQHHVTPAIFLMGAFAIFLSELLSQQDVLFGVNILDSDFSQQSLRFRLHTQAVRLDVFKEAYKKLFRRLQKELFDGREHYLPLSELLKHIEFERKEAVPAFIQVLFSYLQVPAYHGHLKVSDVPIRYPTSKLDMSFYVFEYEDGRVILNVEFASALFNEQKISHFVDLYVQTISKLFGDLFRISGENLNTLLSGSHWQTDQVSVVDHRNEYRYHQLAGMVKDQVAWLTKQGVKAGHSVAVNLPRDVTYLKTILALLELNAHFIPISTAWPNKYQEKILRMASPHFLITTNQETCLLEQCSDEPVSQEAADLAYIIFTSGTTGEPKGVKVSRASVFQTLSEIWHLFAFNENKRIAAITPFSFDISLLELLMPLLFGSTCVLCSEVITNDSTKLAEWVLENQIDVLQATPSVYHALIQAGWANDAQAVLLCGGEQLKPPTLQKLLSVSPGVWHLYGPTEATIWSSARYLTESDDIDLGLPLPGTHYAIDGNLNEGELLISGWNLAVGYFQDTLLTQQRFIKIDGTRYYRTGDLVKKTKANKYYYLGRMDRVHKIRGNRISLSEIESALEKTRVIQNAGVFIEKDEDDQACLTAVITKKAYDFDRSVSLSLYFFGASDQDLTYDDYISLTRQADQLGLSAVWIPERHFDEVGGQFANPAILASALIASTENINIRAGSVVSPLHNTISIAEDWAMLSNLSKGRVGLSLASGWHARDFTLLPEHYHDRKKILLKQIDQCRYLWSGKPTLEQDANGKEWPISVYPSVKQTIPLWMSLAVDPYMFMQAAYKKTHLLTHLLLQDSTALAEKISTYRGTLAALGEDEAQYEVTLMVHAFVHPEAELLAKDALKAYLKKHVALFSATPSDDRLNNSELEVYLESLLNDFIQNKTLIGSPKACQKRLDAWFALGVTEVACLIDFGLPKLLIEAGIENLSKLTLSNKQFYPAKNITAYAQSYLQAQFPSASVPSQWRILSEFPMTFHGKVDYKALMRTHQEKALQANEAKTDVELTDTEKQLLAIWQSCLNKKEISPDAHFYALGGHSLLAMRLIHEINQRFSINMVFTDFVKVPTIKSCARLIEEQVLSDSSITIKKANDNQQNIVTYAQRQSFLLQTLGILGHELNDVVVFRFNGELDLNRFKKSIMTLLKSEPIFSTRFFGLNGQFYQGMDEAPHDHFFEFAVVENTDAAFEWISNSSKIIFDLNNSPLVRLLLAKISKNEHVFSIIIHHIINDGWSMMLLLERLSSLYCNNLYPASKWNMFDYAISESQWLATKEVNQFLNQLEPFFKGFGSDFGWPYAHKKQSFNSDRVYFELDAKLFSKLKNCAVQNKKTLFEYLFLAFTKNIFDLISTDKLICGIPYANRQVEGSQAILGSLVNLMPIPIKKSEGDERLDATFSDILGLTFDFQYVPLPIILHHLSKKFRWTIQPNIHVGFAWQNIPEMVLNLEALTITHLDWKTDVAHLDFLMVLDNFDEEKIKGYIAYNTELFSKEVLQNWLNQYSCVLNGVVENNSSAENIFTLFENRSKQTPSDTAIVFNNSTYRYDSLLELSYKAIAGIQYHNLQPDSRVIIYTEFHPKVIALILAFWRMNIVVLWLDPNETSQERLSAIVRDVLPACVIHTAECAVQFDCQDISLELFYSHSAKVISSALPQMSKTAPAYCIYTSGTTGKPKCPLIPHRALIELISMRHEFAWPDQSVVAQMASLQFDVSILEIWTTLLTGGCLVHVPKALRLQLPALKKYFDQYQVNTTVLATRMFQESIVAYPSLFDAFKTVIFGGENIDVPMLNQYLQSGVSLPDNIINGYGMSETTVINSSKKILAPIESKLTAGKSLSKLNIEIVDEHRALCGVDVVGEIAISGPSICIGLLREGQLIKDRIIRLKDGKDYFLTGDYGYLTSDRQLVVMGRQDDVMKLHGRRIATSEIYSCILQTKKVNKVVVTTHKQKLYAYVVANIPSVNHWQSVYDWVYAEEAYQESQWPIFSGWMSSITGKPFPQNEMCAWLNDIKSYISKIKPSHVLELGVGTGNIAHLLTDVDSYSGVDFSAPVIRFLQNNFVRDNFQFVVGAANALSELNLKNNFYDLIILNSTVQYFSGVLELDMVLSNALSHLSEEGYLFIGDVRDPRSYSDYQGELMAYQEEHREENELLVHPYYFVEFAKKHQKSICLLHKAGRYDNELSRHRYDVILADMSLVNKTLPYYPADVLNDLSSLCVSAEYGMIENVDRAAFHMNNNAKYPYQIVEAFSEFGYTACIHLNVQYDRFDVFFTKAKMICFFDPFECQPFANVKHIEPVARRNELSKELIQYCQSHLPDYMVPYKIVVVPEIALNQNGKTDFRLLSLYDQSTEDQSVSSVKVATSEIEKQLLSIFSMLIDKKTLSVNDNLYNLGLDSIGIIRAVAKAAEVGLTLTPKAIMRTPFVDKLALTLEAQSQVKEVAVSETSDTFLLTAAQQLFFDLHLAQPQHWNLALWVGLKRQITVQQLEQAVQSVCDCHASLKLHFKCKNNQYIPHVDKENIFRVDFKTSSSQLTVEELNEIATQIQASLNFVTGPAIALLLLEECGQFKLFVAIHHLLVDSVSLSIFLQDLEKALKCSIEGAPIKLLAPATSVSAFVKQAEQYALTLQHEITYWQAVCDKSYLYTFPESARGVQADTSVDMLVLDERTTQTLLRELTVELDLPVVSVFVSAFAMAFNKVMENQKDLLINIDSHGRDGLPDYMDLSRTIGWFTSVYPIRVSSQETYMAYLQHVSSVMDEVKAHQYSYAFLKYYADSMSNDSMKKLPFAEIGFNYFGMEFQNFDKASLFYSLPQHCGEYRGAKNKRFYILEVNGFYRHGGLTFRFEFDKNSFSPKLKDALLSTFKQQIDGLIEECSAVL